MDRGDRAAASDPFLITAAPAALAWLVLGIAWLARWQHGADRNIQRMSARDLVRWIAIPTALVVTVVLVLTDLPTRARFELSRSEMDRVADAAVMDQPSAGGPVGLYEADWVEVLAGSVRVDVGGGAYSRMSIPAASRSRSM